MSGMERKKFCSRPDDSRNWSCERTQTLFVRRPGSLIESRVLVETEIHELRCVALADGGRSVRLLDFFKFEIDLSIGVNRSPQITVKLGARAFCPRRGKRQRRNHSPGGPHLAAPQLTAPT